MTVRMHKVMAAFQLAVSLQVYEPSDDGKWWQGSQHEIRPLYVLEREPLRSSKCALHTSLLGLYNTLMAFFPNI